MDLPSPTGDMPNLILSLPDFNLPDDIPREGGFSASRQGRTTEMAFATSGDPAEEASPPTSAAEARAKPKVDSETNASPSILVASQASLGLVPVRCLDFSAASRTSSCGSSWSDNIGRMLPAEKPALPVPPPRGRTAEE
eukprot:CAMPEP_0114569762 /NCGR_PEP_ID=MMETSP0114-20121206/16815_1 /TAXON_ID=31324 /ORGANISM="Goniomonas sp, Strain m" /LENGTH=138 /DNA_ID=CAMNT_0001756695 /DNA_START=68 /DNA_END=481 /DNA_ORIENTATION=-